MSKSSAASMSSKYMGGLKSGRSSHFVMVFFLIGELDRDRLPRLSDWESGSDLAVFLEDIVGRSDGMIPKSPNSPSGLWESRASSSDSGTGSVTRFSTADADNKHRSRGFEAGFVGDVEPDAFRLRRGNLPVI